VQEGALAVSGVEKTILSVGQHCGAEVAFGGTATRTVRTETDSVLFHLGGDAINMICEDFPELRIILRVAFADSQAQFGAVGRLGRRSPFLPHVACLPCQDRTCHT
jgi:hypothetical protein